MRILSELERLLHDIPRFLMCFIEQLFLIFNQMLSIQAFGRRVLGAQKNCLVERVLLSTHNICFGCEIRK